MMKHYIYIICIALAGMLSSQKSYAQGVNMSLSDEDFFSNYAHKKDTTYSKTPAQHRDTFFKRFSLGVNLAGWTMTVPNLMVEFDLNKTKQNNRSLILNARYNPRFKRHVVTPKFVFDVSGVSLQFRKYWRTGKLGQEFYYGNEFQKLHLQRPDTLFRDSIEKDYIGRETTKKIPYFTHEDSLIAEQYTGDPNRSGFYNRYHNVRRTLSGRMIEDARTWRAYYLGAYASFDKYSYCWGKRGERGRLASIGVTAGWSIPLLASAYPHQGGLDLDLGVNIGLPFANYNGYKYVDREFKDGQWTNSHAHYQDIPSRNSNGWKIEPKYIVHDIHISLIYRFRSIANKVDLALVDRYNETEIQKFISKRDARASRRDSIKRAYEVAKDANMRLMDAKSDSTRWADYQTTRYLKAMLKLNPDTTQFSPEQLKEYERLILKMTPEAKEKVLKFKEQEKKQEKRLQQAAEDSIAKREAELEDSIQKADKLTKRLLEKKLKENPDTTLLSPEELQQYERLILSEKREATKKEKSKKSKKREEEKDEQTTQQESGVKTEEEKSEAIQQTDEEKNPILNEKEEAPKKEKKKSKKKKSNIQ